MNNHSKHEDDSCQITSESGILSYTPDEAIAWLKANPVKNLIFDLDDTLYYRSEPYCLAYEHTFASRRNFNWPDGLTLYHGSREIGEEEYRRYISGQITMKEMHIRRTQRSFSLFGIHLSETEASNFEQAYRQAQSQITLVKPFGMFLDWIVRERPETFLGIMTNGQHERQHAKIQALELERWFPKAHIYISGDYGADKPDIRAFRLYEEMTGICPKETILIGDSAEADAAGALAAGWQTLLVQPDRYNRNNIRFI